MNKVTRPAEMNAAFARAFNSREIGNLLALYEKNAVLRVDGTEANHRGSNAIAAELAALLALPGQMTSRNNFCIEHDGIALLRADWSLTGDDGTELAAGSSAEIVRRQPDGSWLYLVDHAMGAALPRVG